MKINITYYSLLIILFTLFSSCIDEKGNYDYEDATDVISIEISNLPNEVITSRDLNLTPTVSNLKEGVEYSYRWFCYHREPQSSEVYKIIELGSEKDLNIAVPLSPNLYYLVLEIKDVKANVFVRKQIAMSVQATEIQKGWFLLKDKDNVTDFDYITTEGVLYENVLRDHSAGGVNLQLPGKAMQMTYQSAQYKHQVIEDGKVIEELTSQKAYHIISEQGYSAINAATIGLFKKFDNAFYETPATVKLQALECISTGFGTIVLNAGKMYTLASRSPNIGLFNYPQVLNQEYEFAGTKSILNSTHALAFDKISKSFKKVAFSQGGISSFSEKVPQLENDASPNNMNADLIQIMPARVERTGGRGGNVTGVAFMKSTIKEEYYLALMELNSMKPYPFIRIDTITDNTLPMLSSSYRATTREGEFIYYTKGNELRSYYYGIAPNDQPTFQRDKLIETFPGEEITCIYNYLEPIEMDNYLLIATSVGGEWKMYQYVIPSAGNPELGKAPLKLYKGEGTVRDILYRRV